MQLLSKRPVEKKESNIVVVKRVGEVLSDKKREIGLGKKDGELEKEVSVEESKFTPTVFEKTEHSVKTINAKDVGNTSNTEKGGKNKEVQGLQSSQVAKSANSNEKEESILNTKVYFRASHFFGDFSGNCFEDGLCKNTPKIKVTFPKEEIATNIVYKKVLFGKSLDKEVLVMEMYDVVGSKKIYFGAPLYPVGEYMAGDIIDYENGYKIEVVDITGSCRYLEMSWDVTKVYISVCKQKGLTNLPII